MWRHAARRIASAQPFLGAAGVIGASGLVASTHLGCRPRAVLLEEAKTSTRPTAGKRPTGSVNVDQEMLKLRRIFLTGDINDDSAKAVVQQLLYFEAEDPSLPVTIFINSGGGLVHSGLAILDVMTHVSMPLKTVAYGRCFSIAALLLASGTPGHRSAYCNARLMIHEPSCSYPKLTTSDLLIKVEELRHTQQVLEKVLSQRTGKSQVEIAAAVSRDRYMSVPEAMEFGLIDSVWTRSAPEEAGASPGSAAPEAAPPSAGAPEAVPATRPAPRKPEAPRGADEDAGGTQAADADASDMSWGADAAA